MNENDEMFSKEYVSTSQTEIPTKKKESVIEKDIKERELKDKEKEEVKKYGISKPQRLIIRGTIVHDKG